MNFNNINGVWPQIKDYIDSKLGGGTSKYKHMIYFPYLVIETKLPFIGSSDEYTGQLNITECEHLYKYDNHLIFFGAKYTIQEQYIAIYSECVKYNDYNYLALKEGWYVNCMGQIYDWKGNIVE